MAEFEDELETARAEFHHHVEIAYTRIRDLMEARQVDGDISPLLGRVEDVADTALEMLRWADRASVLEKLLVSPEE